MNKCICGEEYISEMDDLRDYSCITCKYICYECAEKSRNNGYLFYYLKDWSRNIWMLTTISCINCTVPPK